MTKCIIAEFRATSVISNAQKRSGFPDLFLCVDLGATHALTKAMLFASTPKNYFSS